MSPDFVSLQCHMTNTKITDPETLERRYPVILHEFSIREGSGGKGYYNGKGAYVSRMPKNPSAKLKPYAIPCDTQVETV